MEADIFLIAIDTGILRHKLANGSLPPLSPYSTCFQAMELSHTDANSDQLTVRRSL